MEEKTRKKSNINVGSSLILVTFVLLCLVAFASLSYATAGADYDMTKELSERTIQYYKALSDCEEMLCGIDKKLDEVVEAELNDGVLYARVKSAFANDERISLSKEGKPVITFKVMVSDTQQLEVAIKVQEQGEDGRHYTIMRECVVNKDLHSEEEKQIKQNGGLLF